MNRDAYGFTALIVVLASAAGSVWMTLRAGRHNSSWILPVMFTVWVLAPFVALFYAGARTRSGAVAARARVYSAILVIALGSLVVYGAVTLNPPKAQAAAPFLITPAVSWVLIAILIGPALLKLRRSPQP